MFDAIAARYDLLNHLLSAGLDRRWRARAVKTLRLTGRELVLDLCTGTGDLALAALKKGSQARRVVGIDFAGAMLRRAKTKVEQADLQSLATFVRADASQLPVRDGSIDAVTLAFGIRNVEEPARACAEILRVLRPGGRLVLLEFSLPGAPVLRHLYAWYFRHALPVIGRLISRHPNAYSYLPDSVGTFPAPQEFARQLRACGFGRVDAIPLTLGVVQMFVATKDATGRSRD